MNLKQFNVLTWDFNSDRLQLYDILPYFREKFKEIKKTRKLKKVARIIERNPEAERYYHVPENKEELINFVKNEALYRFWSRCEYEIIIHGWPKQRQSYKMDVYEQIIMNIDIITDILYAELLENKKNG